MAKGRHKCAYCGLLFEKTSDHMVHVVETHSEEFNQKSLKRSPSCWRCANETELGEDQRYVCSCGFIVPTREEILERSENRANHELDLSEAPAGADCSWITLGR